MRFSWPLLVLTLSLAGCEKVQENVVLSPQGEQVEFAMETPSPNAYTLLGDVTGVAAGATLDDAELSARNDMRNKAAAMGATLIVVDSDDGNGLPYQNETKVTVSGRAFKEKD